MVLFVFSVIFSNAFCTFLPDIVCFKYCIGFFFWFFLQNQRYTETFIVSSDLVGFAVGSHGSNIKKAEKIPGVSSVNKVSCDDGGCRFYVHGEVNTT